MRSEGMISLLAHHLDFPASKIKFGEGYDIPMSARPYTSPAEHLNEELALIDLFAARLLESPDSADAQRGRALGLGTYVSGEEARRLVQTEPPDAGASTNEFRARVGEQRRRIRARIDASADTIFLPVEWFRTAFGLEDFAWHMLLACAAPYLDERYRRLYAYLQNDVSRENASIGLLQRLICSDIHERLELRELLANHPAFRDWQIVRATDEPGPVHLTMDASVVDALAGNYRSAADFADCLDDGPVREDVQPSPRLVQELEHLLHGMQGRESAGSYVISFCGRPGSGRRTAAAMFAGALGRPLFRLRLFDLQRHKLSFDEGYVRILRECLLQQAVLYIEDFAAYFDERTPGGESHDRVPASGDPGMHSRREFLLRAGLRRGGLIILACERPVVPLHGENTAYFPVVDFPQPEYGERLQIWRRGLDQYNVTVSAAGDDLQAEDLAGLYRFTAGQIDAALRTARDRALSHGADAAITADDLVAGCRAQCSQKLGELARPIRTVHDWGDLILPEEHLSQLRDIYVYFKQRDRVFDEWEFRGRVGSGRGYHALFAGPPGTGKTMAAGIIAAKLRLEIFKIDLAGVVSKYIGETEKNLAAIFREAEASQAVLFFDEADALFGKRSEVKDSHDRYANIETSYLLQRMEEYDGITILATNLLQNMDEAFLRRLHVVVDFPFPDTEDRRRIWAGMFPGETPLAADVDFDFLAERARIAGGNIKNIALAAAVQAADAGTAVSMEHIMHAARGEYRKIGKPFVEREFVR